MESAFDSYLRGALQTFGIEADDAELAVMEAVWTVYEPGLKELLEADLSGVEPEDHADLSRSP